MRKSFPSREQLETMSLARLRLIDIQERDEEEMLQFIINQKSEGKETTANVFRGDIPDIKTPEDEKKWQEVLDKRASKGEVQMVEETKDVSTNLGEVQADSGTMMPSISIPSQIMGGGFTGTEITTTPTPSNESVTLTARLCEFCDTKGMRHKKDCPTLQAK